jgi:hypothetical protein
LGVTCPFFAPGYIARIGDGEIIRTGDGGNSQKSYFFNMKSCSANWSELIGPVISTATGRDDFISVKNNSQ